MRTPYLPDALDADVLNANEILVTNSVAIHHLAFPDKPFSWYRQQLRRKSCRDFCTLLSQQCLPRAQLAHNDLDTLIGYCKDAISRHESRGDLGRLRYDVIVPDNINLFAIFSWVDIQGLDLLIEEYESDNPLLDATTLGYLAAELRTTIPWDNPCWLDTAMQLASGFNNRNGPPRPPGASMPAELPSGFYSEDALSSDEDEGDAFARA